VVASPEFAEKAQRFGILAKGNASQELDAWTRAEIARWAEVERALMMGLVRPVNVPETSRRCSPNHN